MCAGEGTRKIRLRIEVGNKKKKRKMKDTSRESKLQYNKTQKIRRENMTEEVGWQKEGEERYIKKKERLKYKQKQKQK